MSSPDLVDLDLLDQPARLETADHSGMLRVMATGGPQIREAVALAAEVDLARVAGSFRPRSVLVAGIGVSGLAGDVLRSLVGPTSPVLVAVHRDAGLPGWVGAADAVVGVSASGSSEETLTAVAEGIRRDAAVIGIGEAGSPLQELCERGRAPFVALPPRRPSRAALWSLLAALTSVTRDAWRLHGVTPEDLLAAADTLDEVAAECRPTSETFVNPAKSAAVALSGCVPVVIGTSPVAGAAAYRLSSQLAVNARWPSTWGVLPEAARHLVGVLEGPFARRSEADLFHDPYDARATTAGRPAVRLQLLLLRDEQEHPVVAARADALAASATDRGVRVTEWRSVPGNPVRRLASLVGPADYASVYLALASGVDPTPVRIREDTERRAIP